MKARAFLVGTGVVVAAFLLWGPVRSRHAPEVGDSGRPVRVEVLNGAGVNHAAQGMAEHLRELGFDVVDVRNADRSDYDSTLVVDRVGAPEYARAVAKKLGVATPVQQRNEDLLLEVTVIVGRDLAERYRGGFR